MLKIEWRKLWACALVIFSWNSAANAGGERAFVDFHARSGPAIVGHTFIVYGRRDSQGTILKAEVAGLHTDEENYWRGIIIPLRGSVGRAKDDLAGSPEVIYRRDLTAAEYDRLKAGVRRLRALQLPWHMLFFNCNDFAGEMAELVGIRRPPSLVLPITYVALLSALNGN